MPEFFLFMNGKFGVTISELFDGENIPLLDEVRTAYILNLLFVN